MSRRFAALFDNLSLRSKGFLVVVIPLAAILAALAMFYQYGEKVQVAEEWVNHTYRVGSQIRQLSYLMADAEAGVRGYLLTHDPAFLKPYEAARDGIPTRLVNLKTLVADNPEQAENTRKLETLVRTNMELLDRLRQSSPDGATAPNYGLLEASRSAMTLLRSSLDSMQATERRLMADRTTIAQEAEQHLKWTMLGGGLIGLLGGVLSSFIFSAAIEKRIRRVEKEALSLADGRPLQLTVRGRDEIARLESTLVETSRLLARQSEELRDAHSELEAQVQRRTSQLRQANEDLRQANQIRGAIIRSSPLAIWAVDPSGNVIFWNPAAERIFGWTEAEVIGRPLPVIPPELREEYAAWMERFGRGETISGEERERIRKDGKRIQVEIWTAPLRDARGNISGTIAIDNDVSDRKLLEEQFRQSQRLEAVGRLAGGVAHDFNNLLTVISGYTEALIEECSDRPDLVNYAKEIQYAGDRAASLTAQLLAFGRRQISQPRVVDLNEVVARSTKLFQRVIGEDVEVVTRLRPEPCPVFVDPGHIDQVMMNLVVNARDAMAEGGRLTIETACTVLDEHYSDRHLGVAPGQYCLLAISDTGTGMTSAVKSQIFEPFFTTKAVGKGTGLGLSIVYGIVKQNRGEIGVYSEPGKGTTFKIYLPLAEAQEHADVAAQPAPGAHGSETVLVCEDEERIRRLIQIVLEKLGYRVLISANPKEALNAANGFDGKIDLLLTDVVMPHGNGFELSAAIRKLRRDTKVMYMSGYADHHLAGNRILEEGVPFLQKPFAASTLAKKVKEVLVNAAISPPATQHGE